MRWDSWRWNQWSSNPSPPSKLKLITLSFFDIQIFTDSDLQMLAAGGQMPQISAGGAVMMTLHQVNGDGAGPYECMIDSTGTGTQWTAMDVTTNVPGTNSRSKAKATDFVST